MYATLKDNKLYTTGHDGTQFVVDVDGPGVYAVEVCRQRECVVEFGAGRVTVERTHLAHTVTPHYRLEITNMTFS